MRTKKAFKLEALNLNLSDLATEKVATLHQRSGLGRYIHYLENKMAFKTFSHEEIFGDVNELNINFILEQYVQENDGDLIDSNDSNEKQEVRDPKFSKGQSKRIWNELYKVYMKGGTFCK